MNLYDLWLHCHLWQLWQKVNLLLETFRVHLDPSFKSNQLPLVDVSCEILQELWFDKIQK